jgi:hypothetical protein
MEISRLPAHCFTWSRWRRFNLFNELSIACATNDILKAKEKLIPFIVGFIEGEKLYCRPKENCIAVMFYKENEYSWCHLFKHEFIEMIKE